MSSREQLIHDRMKRFGGENFNAEKMAKKVVAKQEDIILMDTNPV